MTIKQKACEVISRMPEDSLAGDEKQNVPFPFLTEDSYYDFASMNWLFGAGAPRSNPSVLRSSSTSGQ
jgi:hypothetical protein